MRTQSRLLRSLSNDLLWISLALGIYWAFIDQHVYRHPMLHSTYGWVHMLLALWGFLSLYANSTRTWSICLVLLLSTFVDDTVFYLLSREITAAILFACLSWGCLARLVGIYYSGRLFSQRWLDE
jgi:Na+-translocating ferredoxin:NAD+ oxidoreductase RnfD subunit